MIGIDPYILDLRFQHDFEQLFRELVGLPTLKANIASASRHLQIAVDF